MASHTGCVEKNAAERANSKLFYLLFSVNIVYNLHKTDTPLARLRMKQRRKESK